MDILEQNRELEHLDEIKTKLNTSLHAAQESLGKQREELLDERRKMWEEGSHVVMDFDDIVSMATYDARVREEFGHYVRKDETVRQLNHLIRTPYFGRIDFQEEGSNDAEQIYIGRYGFCSKGNYEYDIYDWRTPIANLFYESFPGKASYRCPAGEIWGDLTCKRQYQIRNGILEYCYDTNIAVQDDLLGKVLSENTDHVLRVIIDTITKEQNSAIRQPYGTDLLITGPAGSGKTSVGMHRLAYLLYHNRSNLSSDKIIVMSRNQIFSSYIAGILPELGEENVQDVLFDELINKGISRRFRKEDFYTQAEFLLKERDSSLRKKSIVLKYSFPFLSYLKECVRKIRLKNKDAEAAVTLYLLLLKDYCKDKKEIYEYTLENIEREILLYEDALVIGYLRILSGEIRAMEQICHVVLDEAQDYNRLQLMILKMLYPKSRFTILADANQAALPELCTVEMEVFRQIFGKTLKEFRLPKSYRSTAPINEFAFALLGIQDRQLYVDRPGKAPEQILTNEIGSTVMEILDRIPADKSVGILTCDRDSAYLARQILGKSAGNGHQKIAYLMKANRELNEKIVCMPILLAKGLEFDVVIVWDDRTAEYWERNRALKYLMCTRALHELYLVTGDGDRL